MDPDTLGQIARLEVSNAALETRVAQLEAENERLRRADFSQNELTLVQAYLAQLSMPAWLATEQGVITYANPAYDRTLMIPGNSAAGRCLDELYAPEYAQKYHRNNAEVLATNAEVEVLEEGLLADGTVGTFLVRKFPVVMGNQRWVGGIAANITDLKRTEASLQELVGRWQLAVEGAADGVWEWNLASDEVVLSPQWQAMLGYNEGEISPTVDVWMDRIHPDDMDSVHRALELHLQGKMPIYQCEHRLRHRDGHYVWVLDRGKVIERDSHGQPLRMIGTYTDISDRKRVEHQLRQSQATNQAILESMPDLLLRVRRDGTCYDVIFPRHEEAGLFAPIAHHIDEVLPPELVVKQQQAMGQALDTGVLQVTEHALIKHGRLAYEEVRIAPCGDDECLVVVRDISDRKAAELALRQSEARFMAISDASPANIYILVRCPDGSLYFEHMSRSVEDIHEVSVDAVLADANILIDHTHPDDRAAYVAAVDHSANTLEPFSHQWRIITPSGRVKWLEGRSQPRRRPNGDTAWYGVMFDITDLKQAEAERQQVTLDLQHSLDRLVATQAALQTSEMRLSGVLNSSLDGIVAFRACRNGAGHIVDFEGLISNPAACDMLQVAAPDLVGQSMLQVLPGNKTSGIFDHYVRVVETGQPHREEIYYPYDKIDGWYEVVAVKLGDGIAITFRNITRVKQSELALQSANQQLEAQVHLLNQRNTDMQLLGSLSNALQTCQTTEEAYGALKKLLQHMFPDCGGGLLMLRSPTADRSSSASPAVEIAARWGLNPDPELAFSPLACPALQQGRSLWIDPTQTTQRCCHLSHLSADQTTFCIPVSDQAETLGLLYLHSADPAALSSAKCQLAQTVADQIALALTNLSLRETLRHQSIRDPLTDLYNRRYLEASLTQEIVAAQRQSYPIGVIMLDLDHFKVFNDTYGHWAGDRALQAIAQLLKDRVRGSDIACRYGGEEITLILPGSGLGETVARAEELRGAIAALTWPTQPTAVTASLGVACFPQHGSTPEALLQAADAALYRAKQGGRDRVAMA